MASQSFPQGWDEERVRDVLDHYERQTDDEATAEDEVAFTDGDRTMIEIPSALLPEVRALLARRRAG